MVQPLLRQSPTSVLEPPARDKEDGEGEVEAECPGQRRPSHHQGAHGHVDSVRYENTNNLHAYLNNPTQRNSEHTVTRSEALENFLIFGLRQTHGVSLDEISTTYGADVAEKVQVHLKQFSDLGLLKIQGAQMALTPHAYSISNEIFERCLNLPFAIDS